MQLRRNDPFAMKIFTGTAICEHAIKSTSLIKLLKQFFEVYSKSEKNYNCKNLKLKIKIKRTAGSFVFFSIKMC